MARIARQGANTSRRGSGTRRYGRSGEALVRSARKARRGFRIRDYAGLILFFALVAASATQLLDYKHLERAPELIALFSEPGERPVRREQSSALDLGRIVSRHFAICSVGQRANCIVDGDTLWIEGEKIRIADINTPETSSPECRHEAVLGARAKQRLQALVNAGPFEVRRSGDRDRDQYGRALRTLHRNGRSLGEVLVAEGLAHRWEGYRRSWCA
jgi:endonuclease YncB( thermonuclease family)